MFEDLLAEEPARLVEFEDRPGLLGALARTQPGAHVMQVLVLIDPLGLSADERVDYLLAWERCSGWTAAQQARAFAAMGRPCPGEEPGALAELRAQEDWVREEVAAALRLSPAAADRRLQAARALDSRLGQTWAALARGEVSYLHALAVAEATAALPAPVAGRVQERVLPKASEQTVGQLRSALRRAVLAADPDGGEVRHAAARAGRRVERWELAEGMAALYAELPAEQAAQAWSMIDAAARGLREADRERARLAAAAATVAVGATAANAGAAAAGEVRGLDACRADALVALLLAAGAPIASAEPPPGPLPAPSGANGAAQVAPATPPVPLPVTSRVQVRVTIDLPTLLGLAERPGELAGHGPITASVARALAADAAWHRMVTDPVTGHLLDYGRTTYRPPPALQEFLRARDGTCRFPGCPVPAERCDIDHATPHRAESAEDGGDTSAANCGLFCRRHHRLKHEGGWDVVRDPDGTVTWTSPTGRTYTVPPPDHRPDG